MLTSSEQEDSHFDLNIRVYSDIVIWSDITKEYSHDPSSRENINCYDMKASEMDLPPSSGGVVIEREEKYTCILYSVSPVRKNYSLPLL